MNPSSQLRSRLWLRLQACSAAEAASWLTFSVEAVWRHPSPTRPRTLPTRDVTTHAVTRCHQGLHAAASNSSKWQRLSAVEVGRGGIDAGAAGAGSGRLAPSARLRGRPWLVYQRLHRRQPAHGLQLGISRSPAKNRSHGGCSESNIESAIPMYRSRHLETPIGEHMQHNRCRLQGKLWAEAMSLNSSAPQHDI